MKTMGALLYMEWKKLLCMRWFFWMYLVVLIICSATISATAFIYTLTYYTIAITPMSYDEQSKGEYLLGALPVTRRQIVTAKYLMLIIEFLAINGLFYGWNQFIYWVLREPDSPNRFSPLFLLILGVGIVLFIGIAVPLNLALGPTRARLYMMLLYFSSFGCIGGLFGIFSNNVQKEYIGQILQNMSSHILQNLEVYLLLAIVGTFAVSYLVACKLYERRQFIN